MARTALHLLPLTKRKPGRLELLKQRFQLLTKSQSGYVLAYMETPRAVNLLAARLRRPRTDAIRVPSALMKHTFNDARFVVQPSKDGEYRVHCVTIGPSIEVRTRFLTEENAQNWICSESKAWLEKLVAQAMDLTAPPAIPLSSPS
jgi:hypothetical protein